MKTEVHCAWCGETLYRPLRKIEGNKTGNYFCNNACRIRHEQWHGNCNRGKKISQSFRSLHNLAMVKGAL